MDKPEDRSTDKARYLNRELSWLAFNERVLSLARDESQPLLERVKFLAIFGSNLDEFFQVRVAGLLAQRDARLGRTTPDGRTPEEQLREIRARATQLASSATELFEKKLRPQLAEVGLRVCDWGEIDEETRQHLGRVFSDMIFPTLTPLAVDPAHPFPFISNLSLNLAVQVSDPEGERHFARVKLPPLLPRFLPLANEGTLVPLEQVIGAHLDALFPGMDVVSHHLFRVTRDADLRLDEDEADDLLEAMESGLRRRNRGSSAIRLEIESHAPDQVRQLLLNELELDPEDVFPVPGFLDLSGLMGLHELDRPDLKDAVFVPQTPRALATESEELVDFFSLLSERDVLVHHPYDSFVSSVQAFLERAADDPQVLTIKHTLYRTSGPKNPIVRTLVRAAESGKQVVALVEVKARFDESANIEWARTLEQAGVHVVYGLVGLKTHMKAALVVRRERFGIRRYCHIGTGNYNPATAKVYEDLGIFSASEALGADLGELFNYLTGFSRQRHYREILVAPETLRRRLLELIQAEVEAGDGEIAIKVNHLSDPAVIDALYAASRAGVSVDLIVRGICCLRPGVPGLSENIRVRSILGRYLEHSRILRFGSATRGRRTFIGSADLMPRKLDHRVELMVPLADPALSSRIDEILCLCLEDDGGTWELDGDGAWHRVPRGHEHNLQERLQARANRRASPEPGAPD